MVLNEAGEGFVSLNGLWNLRKLPGEYCRMVHSIWIICGEFNKSIVYTDVGRVRDITKDH